MSGVAQVIDRRGRRVTLERVADGGFSIDPATYGDPLPNTYTAIPIVAVIQPAGARDAKYLESLPEGLQSETRLVMWTRTPLKEDDRILDGVERYRIIEMEDRSFDGQYFLAYLGSLQNDE